MNAFGIWRHLHGEPGSPSSSASASPRRSWTCPRVDQMDEEELLAMRKGGCPRVLRRRVRQPGPRPRENTHSLQRVEDTFGAAPRLRVRSRSSIHRTPERDGWRSRDTTTSWPSQTDMDDLFALALSRLPPPPASAGVGQGADTELVNAEPVPCARAGGPRPSRPSTGAGVLALRPAPVAVFNGWASTALWSVCARGALSPRSRPVEEDHASGSMPGGFRAAPAAQLGDRAATARAAFKRRDMEPFPAA